jgi:hypothetical protein
MVDVACAMSEVKFPDMRSDIIAAVRALADSEYQNRVWIERRYPHEGYFDDFTNNVHILYDDTKVLENPEGSVGLFLRSQEEAVALVDLANAMNAMFLALGTDRSDIEYMESTLWDNVVKSAIAALKVIQ